jgi:hypothetical protein
MNNIFKNKANSLCVIVKTSISSFVCMLVMFFCVQGCSSDSNGDFSSENYTEADLLVASSEFQVFQGDIANFAESLRVNYLNLSKSDKNKFKEILKKITEENNENIEGLYEQMNSIIKIDLKFKLNEIRENSFEKMNRLGINDISRKDIVTAIKKQNFVKGDTIIRLKSLSEPGGNQQCKDACSVAYVGEVLICMMIPPPGDVACGLIASIIYLSCIGAC